VLLGFGDECYPLRDYATALLADQHSTEINIGQLDTCSYIAGEGFVALLLGNQSKLSQSFKLESYEGPGEMISDLANRSEIVILDHNGESKRSVEYQRIRFISQPRVYSNLYGGMPTGSVFDLCVALAFLRYSEFWDVQPTSVLCVSAIDKNHFFAMRLTQ
jgi:hypothetical protein